jgi:hypothetical protein
VDSAANEERNANEQGSGTVIDGREVEVGGVEDGRASVK